MPEEIQRRRKRRYVRADRGGGQGHFFPAAGPYKPNPWKQLFLGNGMEMHRIVEPNTAIYTEPSVS